MGPLRVIVTVLFLNFYEIVVKALRCILVIFFVAYVAMVFFHQKISLCENLKFCRFHRQESVRPEWKSYICIISYLIPFSISHILPVLCCCLYCTSNT